MREYWLIDPARRRTQFNHLTDEAFYQEAKTSDAGDYLTPLLPGFRLPVPTLWQMAQSMRD